MTNRQQRVVLARIPTGTPVEDNFRVIDGEVPEPGAGEFLARTVYLSLDPYLRSAIAGRHMGHAPAAVGDLMPGRSVALVVRSRHPDVLEGGFVVMETGWQEYAVSNGRGIRRLDPTLAPLSTALGLLGMPGLTAWAGLTQLARPVPGETLVVSAATGGVGSSVGQLAKVMGCRVIGVAGSDEKCAIAARVFGFDGCVNYRHESWRDDLAQATRRRVDVYFDNVGGPVLEAAMDLLVPRGRVVLCGLIGQYNTGVPITMPLAPVIRARAQMFGLVVYDYEPLFDSYVARAAAWLREGRMRVLEDRAHGLASAPAAFARLMSGQNVGKSIVVVGPEAIEGHS
jgi:NADPH-dependent curcumin reductase CurA